MMGWKLDYFQKVSVCENLSKVQIWPKRKFDKVLGNFENLYLRNAIKINHGGGLGRFEVQNLPTLKKVLFFKKMPFC